MTLKTGEISSRLPIANLADIPEICPDLYLSDVSKKDKPWDKHKFYSSKVAECYKGTDFDDYSGRVESCANLLEFKVNAESEFKLYSTRFCRVRHCPVCQWRRSLMWKAKAHQLMPKVIEAFPTHRWIFLTLTVRNCPIEELKETIGKMNKAFARLSQLKAFPGHGWIKSLEVTKGANDTAHPHFHILMLVPAGYFGKPYLSQEKWTELWRKSLRIDYQPVVDIRAINKNKDPIPEIFKYQTKESDLIELYDSKGKRVFASSDQKEATVNWLIELTRQMHKVRSVSVGGVLKDYMNNLDEDIEDLIHVDEDGLETESLQSESSTYFTWADRVRKYKYDIQKNSEEEQDN